LDRAVKKAREEKSGVTGYWNKKVLEAEEKNPARYESSLKIQKV
jgi:hypothetical protein